MEHAAFDLGRVSEDGGDQLDVGFITSGDQASQHILSVRTYIVRSAGFFNRPLFNKR
jgi:hypothetical protein